MHQTSQYLLVKQLRVFQLLYKQQMTLLEYSGIQLPKTIVYEQLLLIITVSLQQFFYNTILQTK